MATICEICGNEKGEKEMIRRRLNGMNHFFCSIRCEVSWEKVNLVGVCG